jgi:hypothetical protein
MTQQPAPRPSRSVAVVGHTNAGKTSLLRTLTRRVHFGEVSDRPGTTRHVESVDLEVNGAAAVRFFDTPGLEDAVALREHLAAFDAQATPPERIRRFLQGPEAHGVFEQEAKVLRTMLDIDAAFLVIDVREPVLPKFRDEIELLNSCARPVLPVLNFVRDAASREPAWKELLSAYGLHVQVRFDAAAPFVGAEQDLYNDLATLLRERRELLHGVVDALATEADGSAASRPARALPSCWSMPPRCAAPCRPPSSPTPRGARPWSRRCRRRCSTRPSAAPTTCSRSTAFARATPTRRRCRPSKAAGRSTSSAPRP